MRKQTFKKILAIICSILVVGCLFSGCAEKEPKLEEVIVGYWMDSEDDDYITAFYEGSMGNSDGEIFAYRIVDDKIEANFDGKLLILSIHIIDENILSVTDTRDGLSWYWYRVDAQGNRIF